MILPDADACKHRIKSSIDILRPKPSPFPLIRIGGSGDGAYLIPADLDGVSACFSPGVSNRKDFEDELTENYDIACHMCDFSSDVARFKTPLKSKQTFQKKWLDTSASEHSITLDSWVEELARDNDTDLMLQMDIEGAEYQTLLCASPAVLKRFRIIVVELHALRMLQNFTAFIQKLEPLLVLLNKDFKCVHLHPNNCCGDFQIIECGENIPHVAELTFLRRDRWALVSEGNCYPPLLPHPLDIYRNVASQPPLFLNEHWLVNSRRPLASALKMCEDELTYISERLKALGSRLKSATE